MPYRTSAKPTLPKKCWSFFSWSGHDWHIDPKIWGYPGIVCRKCQTIKTSPTLNELTKAFHNSEPPIHNKLECWYCWKIIKDDLIEMRGLHLKWKNSPWEHQS